MDDERFTHYYIDPFGDKIEVRIIARMRHRFYWCVDREGKSLTIHTHNLKKL